MDIALIVIVTLMILVGFVGIIVPGLPGAGLMLLGMFLYAWQFGWDAIGWPVLATLVGLTLLTIILDYVTAAWGTKKFGGSKYAAWGSIIGGFLGLVILNIPGLLIGLFLGAVAGELFYAKKGMEASLQAGKGALIGFLGGTIGKFLIGLVMIGLFLWKVTTER